MSIRSLLEIKGQFQELGIKSTIPRAVIYQSLVKSKAHPTAEDLHKSISTKYPGVSLGTVYKTLDMLVKNRLAMKVVTDEDRVRYDAHTEPHIHLYCEKTGCIHDHEDPELEALIQGHFERKGIPGFQIRQVQININGETDSSKAKTK